MRPYVTALFLCLAAVSLQGQNRVPNGSFDSDTSGWFVDSRFANFTTLSWASGAARISNTAPAAGAASYVYSPCIAVSPGENLVFRGGMNRPSNQVGFGNGWIFLYWYREPDCRTGSTTFGTGPQPTDATSDIFQTYEKSPVTVPADARGARVGLIVAKSPAGGTYSILFDDIGLFGNSSTPTVGITGPSITTQNTAATYNGSAANCTARQGAWRWSATGPATFAGGDVSSSQVGVTWSQAGNFSLMVTHADCAGASATFPVTVNAQTPDIVVASFPDGMVQYVGQSGGATSYALANRGSSPATVTLTADGTFFDHQQGTLTIGAGTQALVGIVGRTQANAGTFTGNSRISGPGVPAGLSVVVQLLSAPIPNGSTSVTPVAGRAEVPIPEGANGNGVVTFRNVGSAVVSGIITSTASWLIPTTTSISIPPGATQQVTFIVDAAKRAEAGIAGGTSYGAIVVRYLTPFTGKGLVGDADPAAGSARASAAVAATASTAVSNAAIPALGLGEFAYVVPVVAGTDAKVDVAMGSRLGSSSVTGAQLFLQSAGAPSQRISLPSFGSNALLYANIARTIFQQTNISGSLQIRSASNDSVLPVATLVSEVSGRSASANLPVFRSDRATGSEETIQLPGVRREQSLTTDVYLQEVSGAAVNAAVEFRNDTGVVLGSASRDLAPFGAAVLADAIPAGATQIVVRLTGSGRAAVYAVARHAGGTRAVIADWRRLYGVPAGEAMVVPLIPRGEGDAADRRYDLHLSNADGSGTATVTGELFTRVVRRRGARLGAASNPGASPITKTWTVGAGESRTIRDLAATFGVSVVDGYLVVKTSGGRPAFVAEAIDPTPGGDIPAVMMPFVPRSVGRARGVTTAFVFDDFPRDGIARDGALESDLGFIESAGAEVRVRVTLQYPSKGSAAVAVPSTEFRVGPFGSLLVSDVVSKLVGPTRNDLGELRGARLQMQVISGDGRVLPYLVQRDISTGAWLVRPPQQ
jgi:hypothetical protein